MGSQKKSNKRQERLERKKASSSSAGSLSYVLYAFLGVAVALGGLVLQNWLRPDLSSSDHYSTATYATGRPDDVVEPDHLDPALLPALSVYTEAETHPDRNVRQLPKDLSKWPPGERGVGVTLDESKMSEEEKAKRKRMYKSHAFEEYVSDLISYNRSLPDWRGDWCRSTYDPARQDLDTTSVVICFHNEAWSTLVRTVHSIINRTPAHLLEEILLIDDKSDMDHLGQRLEDYMAKFDKIKLVRQPERQGLIRCRMLGAQMAKAEVLTFLDSHVETGIGWLEPLMYRVKDNPKTIVSPVIDAINDTTFWYTFIHKDLKGLMNWRMTFEWHELSAQERRRKENPWAPHDNPIMSGGLFAIGKKWFEELGYYDTGMEIWGGENFEVSFKAWMCGGRVEISPCSRVGHVFRTWSPYKVDTDKVSYNNIRVAEVWMDEFKYLYYDRQGRYDEPLADRLGPYGDVNERLALRQRLQCKSFRWYLDKVALGFPYHPLLGAGELRNPDTNYCLDQNDHMSHINQPVYAIPCHGQAGNQYWWYNRNRFLLRDYLCVGVEGDGLNVAVMDCGHVQHWRYDEKKRQMRYGPGSGTGKCLVVGARQGVYAAQVAKCDPDDPRQQWVFSKYDERGLDYEDLGDLGKLQKY